VDNTESKKMADLTSAMEKLQLDAVNSADDWIDQILEEQQRPRKRVKQDQEELKRELEQKYLTPSKSFSNEWLNKLQQ
jgi:antiviral helicase SKI2